MWCPCLWFKPHFFILNFLPIKNNNNGSSMGIIFWHLFLIVGGCLGSQTLNFAHMFQLVACFLKTTCVCLWTKKKRKEKIHCPVLMLAQVVKLNFSILFRSPYLLKVTAEFYRWKIYCLWYYSISLAYLQYFLNWTCPSVLNIQWQVVVGFNLHFLFS